MSGFKNKTPAEELIESLLKDVGEDAQSLDDGLELDSDQEGEEQSEIDPGDEAISIDEADIAEFLGMGKGTGKALGALSESSDYENKTKTEYEKTRMTSVDATQLNLNVIPVPKLTVNEAQPLDVTNNIPDIPFSSDSMVTQPLARPDYKAEVIRLEVPRHASDEFNDSERTVAVAGYQVRKDDNYDDRVKVSVGQSRSTTGYATWGSAGSAESNLAHADNLRIAQEKILELETENEKIRLQNEELMAASEIIKERSDLLSSQVLDYKNDRESLEESYKNETVLLKNHLGKKENELQKALLKADELDSRLKFDMKKIRVRERELENRLELIRAEKNAIVKNKDEQILDLRRKMDVLQMEVESYRQKCVELNRSVETNQESFKRTTRALRLAMANLELQEENKAPLKKAD